MSVRPDPRRWWALGLLSAAQFLVILDTSIIGVALPAIQDALGFTPGGLQWVFNAYVIAFGGLLLLGGRLSDLYGPRRVLTGGFLVLGASSLLAGLAWSSEALIVGRALMGVGAALIAPAALSIVMSLFAGTGDMGKAMGIWGASAPAGGTAGVFLGGVITEWLDWRWVFLVNVPVAVGVLALIPALIDRGASRKGRIDFTGALAVTGALTLAVYAIVTANDVGWSSFRTIGSIGLSVALLGAFAAVEARRREPLVPLRIFRVHNLSAANAVMVLLGAAWIPMWFYLNLYLQQTLGYGAFEGGLALLPMTVAIMVLMVGFTGRILVRFGYKPPLVAGLLLLAGAMFWFGTLPQDGSFWIDVLPPSLLAAVGMSLAYIPALISALSSAKPEESGLASGLVNTTYQVGSALGLAAMTALATSVTADALDGGRIGALTDGFRAAFFGASGVAVAAALVAVVLIRRGVVEIPATVDEESLERAA